MAFKPAALAKNRTGAFTAPSRITAKFSPTTPSVAIPSPYVRGVLNNRPHLPVGMADKNTWHTSNLPIMATKQAELSDEAKNDLRHTAVIGALGVGASVLTHKLMDRPLASTGAAQEVAKGLFRNNATNSALIGGGLGLAGDYAAVKLNKAMDNKPKGNMNKIAEMLLQKAASLREGSPELVALALLKQAGVDEAIARAQIAQDTLEKSAAESLTFAGIDMVEATRLVKAANVDASSFAGVCEPSEDELLANQFEKLAEYVQAQDEALAEAHERIRSLEEATTRVGPPAELPTGLSKMATAGALTFEEIDALSHVPSHTLSKIASAIDAPWEFGRASGSPSASSGDPLVDFCMA